MIYGNMGLFFKTMGKNKKWFYGYKEEIIYILGNLFIRILYLSFS